MLSSTRLIELRTWLGLSQEALARLFIVSMASVNRWERGHTAPSGTVLALYKALDLAQTRRVPSETILGEPASPGEHLRRILHSAYGDKRPL